MHTRRLVLGQLGLPGEVTILERVEMHPAFDQRRQCEDGDRRACIQFGIMIGRNWERRERWRQESPEFFMWERDR